MKKLLAVMLIIGLSSGALLMAETYFSPDQEKTVLAFLEDHIPTRLEELKSVRADDEREYGIMVGDLYDLVDHYNFLKEVSPDTARALLKAEQLEEKTWPLAEKIIQAEGDEKKVLEAQMKDLLTQIFDLRLKELEFDVQDLEEQLEYIRDQLERRKKSRDKIIEHRSKEILSEVDEAISWW